MQTIDIIYSIVILVFSVVIHEVAHGYMALFLGDPTAKYEKRLTLNPIKHLDFFGSVIVPLITSLMGFTFGWAKPVPYNPYNLKSPKWGGALIALAGPASNFIIALCASLVLGQFSGVLGLSPDVQSLILLIILVNVSLMVFNLVPLYPLDGSKILFAFIPNRYGHVVEFVMRYSLPIFIIAVVFFGGYLGEIVGFIVKLLLLLRF